MDQLSYQASGMEGTLPALAPLANPYVPFQKENPPKYGERKAFIRGTLFPGLDLPFMGMVNEKEKPMSPLNQVQTLGFVVQELALYLDTHKDDLEALELYQKYQKQYAACMAEYQKQYGSMNHAQITDGEKYEWLNGPWPWEYSKNREG